MDNRNNTPLPPAVAAAILQHLIDARALAAPYLVPLTMQEREELPKMGDKTLAFVTKAAELAGANSALLPAYLDVAGLQLDADTVAQFLPIIQALEALAYDVSSTQMLAGSEGYVSALLVYSAFQQAARAGQPAAQSAVTQLKPRFKNGGGSKPAA